MSTFNIVCVPDKGGNICVSLKACYWSAVIKAWLSLADISSPFGPSDGQTNKYHCYSAILGVNLIDLIPDYQWTKSTFTLIHVEIF